MCICVSACMYLCFFVLYTHIHKHACVYAYMYMYIAWHEPEASFDPMEVWPWDFCGLAAAGFSH